ncbi:hypothetical protein COY23_02500 [bacterium (Candidatus Torokbacteria) CG_4_10_14_0_2_um_filter_35_8]|nr:MAG: hypothetical protein COY23_02500 [bacterium (Candidatus Torokbacteria) CG_4_10_14_0_2_um_filter_35_8]
MITEKEIKDKLKEVVDPHTQINLVDMDLIKEVDVKDKMVKIKMTLTNPACPLADFLVSKVREKVKELKGVEQVLVDLVF